MKTSIGSFGCSFAERVLRSEKPVFVLLNKSHGGAELLKELPGYSAEDLEKLAVVESDPKEFAALPESSVLWSQEGLALFNNGMLVYYFLGEPSKDDVCDLLRRARKLVQMNRTPDLPVHQGG